MRRGRDSNPRNAFGVYTLSRRASSTTRAPLLSVFPLGLPRKDPAKIEIYIHLAKSTRSTTHCSSAPQRHESHRCETPAQRGLDVLLTEGISSSKPNPCKGSPESPCKGLRGKACKGFKPSPCKDYRRDPKPEKQGRQRTPKRKAIVNHMARWWHITRKMGVPPDWKTT